MRAEDGGAAIAAEAWAKAIGTLTGIVPGGVLEYGARGTVLALTGSRLTSLNAVASLTTEPDPDEIAAFAAAAAKRAEVPWTVQLRSEPDEVVPRIAADYGLTVRSRHPFMIKHLDGEAAAPGRADSLTVRVVEGDESEKFLSMVSAGFEAPRAMFALVASGLVLDGPGMTAYLAEVDGVAVATGFGVVVGDCLGVFNISTLPEFRRRGYGRAVTEAVLRGGRAQGARMAFLHASTAGLPVYRSLGFHVAEQWTYFDFG